MILGRVVGRAWSDRQVPALAGHRFLLVNDLSAGTTTVAVDLLDVGVGVTVLVATDEAAAAASGVSCVDAAVVALVSDYEEGA
ncbi:EutN/CcmL family microcompartment protein [Kibdelosporangium aridum]|uniref:Carboxysome shell and ethanolamine utilization microcompartment protein CcmK/EutM n=1 Tax=Kibdelosporangium aridum TaxID=2030 RepID=A0A1Y5Y6U1_KIBAR|nr:EutN/CcmL family microcompartment protein [Kibdelosporangium aridum]SMD26594.1 Carboxysome shell and ethanolamine utilization microcompartment protein CcmK/EutM [Kibdelosporangium aridum]